ncbi:MAG: glycoside hydrolase family 3 C-terminal domain-containing protein [Bacteroidaceae bacterium]|nr:glycoside hydrolase family 3 C-terminal domain-containing protein [Bacteroidaceae bacterium]
MNKKLVLCVATALVFGTAQAQKLNPNNVDDIVKAMTVEEKAELIVGAGWGSMTAGAMTASSEVLVPGAAGTTNPIERLGIPATVLSDGPAGVRISPTRKGTNKTFYATGFPVGTSLASTWNTELVEQVGKAIGNEVLEYGIDVLLAPGMNIHRNPLNGRNFEYYSEDPYLTGKIATAYTKGIQSNGVGVSIKHYAANSQETNRMAVDSRVNQRALREIYLKAFEMVVKEADPWTVMSSYNKLNGKFTQQDRELLTDLLRTEWGFKGIVMTDWTMVRDIAAQVHAGNDLMEPGMPQQKTDLVKAIKEGKVSMEDVDVCVKRILEYIVRTPRFKGYKYSDTPDLKAHAQITRNSAAEGMVLLKNEDNALPIKDAKKIALFGITSYNFIAGGTGSGNVNKAYTIDMLTGLKSAGYEVNEELKSVYETYTTYERARQAAARPAARGMMAMMSLGDAALKEMPIERAIIDKQVATNDIAIVTIGRNAGEGADRNIPNDFNLSEVERQLLNDVTEAFHLAGKKVIVVLNIGGEIESASWKNLPDAILLAWQPGQEGGYSVADILSGKVTPSGKLTMTWLNNYMDDPSSKNFPFDQKSDGMMGMGSALGGMQRDVKNVSYSNFEEGIWVGYRYFNTIGKEVSFPFGYGLSYTTFNYSAPKVTSTKDGFRATVTVKNTGNVAGKEVVQLYVSAPAGNLVKPEQELKGFAKTKELQPGESQIVTIDVNLYTLASFNEIADQWETAAGNYAVKFGANVEDIRCTATYKLSKGQTWKALDILKPEKEVKEIAVK